MAVEGSRGKCLYKTGKCENERALKTNGQPHNLCDMHRLRQNQNQRKLDGKNRHNRTQSATSSSVYYASSPSTASFPSPSSHDYSYAHSSLPALPYPPSPLYPTKPDTAALLDDDITVRTPSYLKGEAREAFRSRVLQKLVNIISEEVLTSPPYPNYDGPRTTYGASTSSYAPPTMMYHDRATSYMPPAMYPPPPMYMESRPYGASLFPSKLPAPTSLPPLTQCIAKDKAGTSPVHE
ncbi:hypothetical protein SPRG_20771 [Saprolegnia parasitica CBS 223.65]|uniref:Uncharacterized protein n=1 Tax=Saprolegnia parasitica (strain CBS 223.65) TaxID=695850 RepID=A0A067C3X9_SAPPC|nr:hypothetical protein SPRG_20771 [Saprolegnia parasitica CBS 223.65]KDO25188.1 hypothetical protein SPRG_20771 [Saprolegnia parasitica CBS 223.65]|eukprot:XP_012204102.1 hypothetical protein SPRG_20771 [Saprolegnia parasitica CBS 223.65]